MKTKISLLLVFLFQFTFSQVDYGTPANEPLPEKLQNLKVEIEVMHFPKENDPIKIKDEHYWKHATAILSKKSEVKILEFGAYLFYNDKWNLRKSYDLEDLDKNFDTKKQTLLQGQPYVWIDNWRIDNRLFGGWAMWYFIGTNDKGETICGYETIHTTSNLLNK
jgi:hypothetical protein